MLLRDPMAIKHVQNFIAYKIKPWLYQSMITVGSEVNVFLPISCSAFEKQIIFSIRLLRPLQCKPKLFCLLKIWRLDVPSFLWILPNFVLTIVFIMCEGLLNKKFCSSVLGQQFFKKNATFQFIFENSKSCYVRVRLAFKKHLQLAKHCTQSSVAFIISNAIKQLREQ